MSIEKVRKTLGNMCRSSGEERKSVFGCGRQGIGRFGGQWDIYPLHGYILGFTTTFERFKLVACVPLSKEQVVNDVAGGTCACTKAITYSGSGKKETLFMEGVSRQSSKRTIHQESYTSQLPMSATTRNVRSPILTSKERAECHGSSSTLNPNLDSKSPRSPLHGNLDSLDSTKSRISLLGSRNRLAHHPRGAA